MTALVHAFPDEADPARRLAEALHCRLALIETHTFPDGEVLPRVAPSTSTTILYRSLNRPNAKIVELLLVADGLRRAGAQKLILVAPYLPYMRQDEQFHPGEPVSQRVMAGMLDGVFDRIVTVDPHLHRTHSLDEIFRTSLTSTVHGMDALEVYLRNFDVDPRTLVVGPDQESGPWVQRLSTELALEAVVLAKRRHGDRNISISLPSGFDPAGRPVLVVDDICSTGSTLCAVVKELVAAGAKSVSVFVTHALCDDTVLKLLHEAGADRLISSDACVHRTNVVELADALAASLQAHIAGA
jgi:ribose-phosphate pyrophosphokinase